jgi:hypothetical protein
MVPEHTFYSYKRMGAYEDSSAAGEHEHMIYQIDAFSLLLSQRGIGAFFFQAHVCLLQDYVSSYDLLLLIRIGEEVSERRFAKQGTVFHLPPPCCVTVDCRPPPRLLGARLHATRYRANIWNISSDVARERERSN